MEKTIQILQQTPLFQKADPQNLRTAISQSNFRVETVEQGQDPTTKERALGILLSGSATVLSNDRGRTVILRVLEAGDVFGAAALFCPEELPLSRIEATEPCKILYLSEETVCDLIANDRGVQRAYLTFLASRVRFLNRKICCFTAGTALRRLALWLISEEKDTIVLSMSISDLSDMLDIGRASLYRAFEQLAALDLIQKNGKKIVILDRKRLSEDFQTERN